MYTSVSRERNKKRRKMLWHIQGWLPITFYFEFPIFALVDGEYLNKRFGADFFLPPSRSSVLIFFSFVIAKEKKRDISILFAMFMSRLQQWINEHSTKRKKKPLTKNGLVCLFSLENIELLFHGMNESASWYLAWNSNFRMKFNKNNPFIY